MLIRQVEEVQGRPMDMPEVLGVTMRLMVGREDGAANFAMRHFTVDSGGHTPRHRHNYEHEVYVVEGTGQVEQEGQVREIRAGDVVYVVPGLLHQFTNPGPGPFKFLCIVPTSFDCSEEGRRPTPGS